MNRLPITIILLISLTSLWAQKPKDTLNTEVINVVKPYSPSISDAFKIKDLPKTTDESIEKETIDYKISSVPVASTFTPSKGKAKMVSKPKRETLFDNFISVGFGNYTTPLLEAYIRSFPNKYAEFGALINHHSSQGGIKDLLFADSFYNTDLELYYKNETRDLDWKISFGAAHQQHNWYGLPETTDFSPTLIDGFNSRQAFLNYNVTGSIDYYDSYFKGGKASLSSLSDRFNSNEIRFRAEPVLEFPISSELINFEFDIDYLKGNFDRNYEHTKDISYTYFNIGITPNFEILRDELRINLGAKLYATTGEGDGISLKAYPNVAASFQLIEEVLSLFAGVTGGLHQNSYANILVETPYISPNFESQQTDEKYRAYGGIKGKLASNINYLFKGTYADERDKPLLTLNPIKTDGITMVEEVYELGNSFNILYDDIKTLAFYGELSIDFSKEFTFGGNANYAIYDTTTEEEAWNLPNIKLSLFADYHANKWTGNAKLFMMGERNDLETMYDPFGFQSITQQVTLGSYLDMNASLSYAFTDRLSAFGKLNNLLGTNYNRFYNYPVQGLQVLGGITYKFDL